MSRGTPLLLALAALLSAGAASAQARAPEYRRTLGDTLRYREVTRTVTHSQIVAEEGLELRDARIAVAFSAGDTAVAWYEALRIEAGSKEDLTRTPTKEVLWKPFRLHFTGRGVERTVAAPDLYFGAGLPVDLPLQFHDFFPLLPDRPLRPGLEWADTIADVREDSANALRQTTINRYRVLGDSVVAGRRAVVLAIDAERVTSIQAKPDRGRYDLEERARSSGEAYFSVESGLFLGRKVAGTTQARMVIHAVSARNDFFFTGEVTSTIELLPPRG